MIETGIKLTKWSIDQAKSIGSTVFRFAGYGDFADEYLSPGVAAQTRTIILEAKNAARLSRFSNMPSRFALRRASVAVRHLHKVHEGPEVAEVNEAFLAVALDETSSPHIAEQMVAEAFADVADTRPPEPSEPQSIARL